MTSPVRWLPEPGKPLPLATIWAVFPVFMGLVLGFSRAVSPFDYWWSVVVGRFISETGTIPDQNIFLYSFPAETTFLNQPWLAQWLMYQFHNLGGAGLGIAVLALFCAIFGAVVLRGMLRDGADLRYAAVTVTVALSLAAPVAAVRTRMFAIVPAVVIASLLFGYRRENVSAKWLWWIVPLTIWWSNVHGSFVVAVAWCWLLCGDLFFEKFVTRTRSELSLTPFAVAFATTFAGMINPLGFDTYIYVVHLALESSVAATVTEWQPPSITEATGVLFLIILLFTIGAVSVKRKTFSLFEVSAFALTVYLGASATRSLLFCAIVFPLLVAPVLARSQTSQSTTTRAQGWLNTAILAAGILLCALAAPVVGWAEFDALRGATRRSGEGVGVMTPRNAVMAVPELSGRIFHDQAIGGLVEYHHGAESAFVDQRMELVPQSVWDDYYAISDAQPTWRALVEKYQIETFVLSPDEQYFLIQELLVDEKYELRGYDENHVVFVSLDRFQDPPKQ